MKNWNLQSWLLKVSTPLYLLNSAPTVAQIKSDATLLNNSLVTNQGQLIQIDGGTRAGSNLFHSFSQFSVPTGGTAFFNNTSDVSNIFSRITSGSISNINGILQANGTANLFLLNPNGIIFGKNVQLKIGGSFLASTASSIKFADGSFFSAKNPQAAPPLTINVPMGLQFGQNPGAIRVEGEGNSFTLLDPIFSPIVRGSPTGLQVQPGKTLALAGGDVTLEGVTVQCRVSQSEFGLKASSKIMQAVDILILSNGPGELATWVLPVVKALRQQLGDDRSSVRISVVLSPCPNATGKEVAIARSYRELDRVQGAEHFFAFLLWGKTVENWDWRSRGVVLFLGGDQFFSVVIGRRLGYRTVVYAEWEARWHHWIDRFGVMKPEIIATVHPKYAHKFTVVGDLMAEAQNDVEPGKLFQSPHNTPSPITKIELIGLLPGSKPAKLAQGVPFALKIAEQIHAARPQTRFVIPLAPTLDLTTLAKFADSRQNPVIQLIDGSTAQLILPAHNTSDRPFLKTANGLRVELWTEFPAYDLLSQCCICLTTVGANTAELGALAVPMIVLLPTQQLDAMRTWDGLPGLLANLPLVGSGFAKLINLLVMRQKRLFAWPNIWANSEIVPELLGKLQAQDVAERILDFLNHPEKLQEMSANLRQVRGEPGSAQKLAQLVREELFIKV